jgi:glycosyltransferase A (GT-A) superfamily protein (DUF2064 family)
LVAQRETDFGDRLFGAIRDLFSAGFAAVCLINADSPTLPFQYLLHLATFLKQPKDRLVLGPSLDGVYYALGLRHAHPRIFEEITWNTDRVYEETIERSKEINLPIVTLPAWYDVGFLPIITAMRSWPIEQDEARLASFKTCLARAGYRLGSNFCPRSKSVDSEQQQEG